VIIAVPGVTPVTRPLLPIASLTVATVAGDDVHSAEFVRSCVLPSAKVPVALNCVPVSSATVAVAGVI